MIRNGGCQCGEVRYEIEDDEHELFVCHCSNCRRQSSSAFGISFSVPAKALRLVKGSPRYFEWKSDSGAGLRGAFCPSCGTRLWHESADDSDADWRSVKGGSLDDPVDLSSAIHIWTSSKLPGVQVPTEARQHPQEPPNRLI